MQKKIITAILVMAICFTAGNTLAQNDDAGRLAAADRYLKAVPLSIMLEGAYKQIAQQIPLDQRDSYISKLKKTVRVEALEQVARDALTKTFTADELNALADFYESKAGASAMKKFGDYMKQLMPVVQLEIQRAMQELAPKKSKQ